MNQFLNDIKLSQNHKYTIDDFQEGILFIVEASSKNKVLYRITKVFPVTFHVELVEYIAQHPPGGFGNTDVWCIEEIKDPYYSMKILKQSEYPEYYL